VKTRNPNELKGIIEKYCHSGRSVAKTRNPGGAFLNLILSTNGLAFIQTEPEHFQEDGQSLLSFQKFFCHSKLNVNIPLEPQSQPRNIIDLIFFLNYFERQMYNLRL